MKYRSENAHGVPELSRRDRNALVVCGLWLRLGFIGACGFAGVLHQLLNGEMKPLSAVALLVGAGTLAAVGLWRARAVLDVSDGAVVAPATESSPANAAVACSVV
jgi:hypothetical protein